MKPKKELSEQEFRQAKESRETRLLADFEVRAESDSMVVEGYAATFERATVLYEYDGVEYKEVIARGAFDGTDMSDVILNYNHGGKVLARTRNNTLELLIDNTGLRVKADLGGTEEGRALYEEIKGGYIDRMSFRFTVNEDSYERDTHTRTILGVKKLWDVSAVDIPAYDSTNINARSYFEAEAEKERVETQNQELRKRKLQLKLKMKGVN